MGFALTILYLVTYYLNPFTVFGQLAWYHTEVIVAVLVVLFSLPALLRSFLFKTSQSVAVLGMGAAIFFSILVTGWFTGAVNALQQFIPNAFAYYLICINCNTRKKFNILVLMLLGICIFVIYKGAYDLHYGIPPGGIQTKPGDEWNRDAWDLAHPYILPQDNDQGEWIFRIRGLAEINDPNDFAQLLVSVIPLLFIFWRPKKFLRNSLFVLLPVAVLLYGTFLTHSRGSLVALVAMAVVAARRKIGTLPSVIIAGGLFVAATALSFTGGRNMESGEGRMVLWAMSVGLFKSNPIFGVGFGHASEYLGHTSHNSIMVCAAELGMFGLYFWAMFLLATMRDTLTFASPDKVAAGDPDPTDEDPWSFSKRMKGKIDQKELIRLGRLLVISFTGFLTTGFFLSRAFVLTFFLLGGMTEVLYQMGLQRRMIPPRLKLGRVLLYSAPLSIGLILSVYLLMRVTFLF